MRRGRGRLQHAGAAWAVATVAVGLALGSTLAQAGDLYRFVDEKGVIHFTDEPKGDDRYVVIARPRGLTRSGGARSTRYDAMIRDAGADYGVPAAMVKAVIAAESAFNAEAVSPKGAMGLMQLMPATAEELGVRRPFRAAENVRGGTQYLRWLHDKYGSWTHTLAAYNAGPGAVDEYRGVPPYRETRQYVQRVLSYYRRFHDDFAR